jgi:hypothetical protein
VSSLEKVVAAHQATVSLTPDELTEEQRDAAAVELSLAGVMALAEARAILRSADPVSVPAHLRDAVNLVLAAGVAFDGVSGALELSAVPDWVESTAFDARAVLLAGDASKPYGDENYADPGYQSDGKKRYPTTKGGKPSEERIRAAWAYINKGSNAGQYSSSQLASIKSKIMRAAKAEGIEIEDDSDSKKVAASNVALAGAPMLEMPAIMHKPMHGVHSHPHVHLADNRHGPREVRLAAGVIAGESTATLHKAFTGAHHHPHVHAGDATHGPMQALAEEAGGRADNSW